MHRSSAPPDARGPPPTGAIGNPLGPKIGGGGGFGSGGGNGNGRGTGVGNGNGNGSGGGNGGGIYSPGPGVTNPIIIPPRRNRNILHTTPARPI